MIQYRSGNKMYVSELKRLWKDCFQDEDAYIDAFFASFYKAENVLLAEENGMLMGASFFLPGRLYLNGIWQPIRYVYALATWPQFRGQGIAGGLLRHAYAVYQAPLIAEPEEEGLIEGFYEPLRFSASFYLDCVQTYLSENSLQAAEVSIEPGRPETGLWAANIQGSLSLAERGWKAEAADAETYYRYRERNFCKNGYVSWPLEHIAFAIKVHRENGGEALKMTGEGREELLLYYQEEGQVVVTETTLTQDEAAELCTAYVPGTADRLVVRSAHRQIGQMQPDTPFGQRGSIGAQQGPQIAEQILHKQLVGMVYGIAPVNGYLNLTLD